MEINPGLREFFSDSFLSIVQDKECANIHLIQIRSNTPKSLFRTSRDTQAECTNRSWWLPRKPC
jgi:hypothetical protein